MFKCVQSSGFKSRTSLKNYVVVVVEAVIPALGRVEAEVILGYRWGSAWDIRYTISKEKN